MRNTRVWITLGCCLLTVAAANAQRKAGLWEVTSTMNMGGGMPSAPQMPPNAQMPQNIQLPPGVQLPPGMQMPQMPQGGGGSPFGGHTMQVCVTDEMIKKYGGPFQQPPRGDCKVSDVSLKPTGMTAVVSCTGQFTGTGTVQTTFIDSNNAQTNVHMKGTAQMGNGGPHPIDMTMQVKSTYKGPDCGSVKPLSLPPEGTTAK